ncbi:MAG: DUF2975 domain-containing protein [Anaerolineales bacterium]|nr:DUF2975 domain-containing protein [Anaerolineales bacterium]
MDTTEKSQLARILKIVLDIIFGLLVFACVALVLWMALWPLISHQAGIPGTASLPVRIGAGEEPQFEVTFTSTPNDAINLAYVEEAEGTLRLETRSTMLIVISNAAKLVLAMGLAYIFYLLREVVQAILDGEPFVAENVRRIRRLGYAVLVVGILGSTIEYLAATVILNRLPTTVPVLSAGPTFDASLILAALFILLLAQIWSYGLELERDRALTI